MRGVYLLGKKQFRLFELKRHGGIEGITYTFRAKSGRYVYAYKPTSVYVCSDQVHRIADFVGVL